MMMMMMMNTQACEQHLKTTAPCSPQKSQRSYLAKSGVRYSTWVEHFWNVLLIILAKNIADIDSNTVHKLSMLTISTLILLTTQLNDYLIL